MGAKFKVGEKVRIYNHPDKSEIGKEVEIINAYHSDFSPQKGYVDEWLCMGWYEVFRMGARMRFETVE